MCNQLDYENDFPALNDTFQYDINYESYQTFKPIAIGLERQISCLENALECLENYGQSSQYIIEGPPGSGKHFLILQILQKLQGKATVTVIDAKILTTSEIITSIVYSAQKNSKTIKQSKNLLNININNLNTKSTINCIENIKNAEKVNSNIRKSDIKNVASDIQDTSENHINSQNIQSITEPDEIQYESRYGRHCALQAALDSTRIVLAIHNYEFLAPELLYALCDRIHHSSSLLLILTTSKFEQENFLGLRIRSRLTAEKITLTRTLPAEDVALQITIQELQKLMLTDGKENISIIDESDDKNLKKKPSLSQNRKQSSQTTQIDTNNPKETLILPENIYTALQAQIKHNLQISQSFHFTRNLALDAFLTLGKLPGVKSSSDIINSVQFNFETKTRQALDRRFNFSSLSKEAIWLLSFCFLSTEKTEKAVKELLVAAPANILTEQQKFILSNCFTELKLCGILSFSAGKSGKFKINCSRDSTAAAITSRELRKLFTGQISQPTQQSIQQNIINTPTTKISRKGNITLK